MYLLSCNDKYQPSRQCRARQGRGWIRRMSLLDKAAHGFVVPSGAAVDISVFIHGKLPQFASWIRRFSSREQLSEVPVVQQSLFLQLSSSDDGRDYRGPILPQGLCTPVVSQRQIPMFLVGRRPWGLHMSNSFTWLLTCLLFATTIPHGTDSPVTRGVSAVPVRLAFIIIGAVQFITPSAPWRFAVSFYLRRQLNSNCLINTNWCLIGYPSFLLWRQPHVCSSSDPHHSA